ncbi:MAG: hypothetical protein QMD23_05650 [Candidatus Bathyarchaeia archaeon]|nr:hypothetical protein [Candidatus Bathyarchaeia archaeon]
MPLISAVCAVPSRWASTCVEKLIKVHVGADKRTIPKYMKMLTGDFGFLEAAAKNPLGIIIYRIDIATVEKYVSEHMKEKLRQLTLLDVRLREEEVKAEII